VGERKSDEVFFQRKEAKKQRYYFFSSFTSLLLCVEKGFIFSLREAVKSG
jgi:hypothetical protein